MTIKLGAQHAIMQYCLCIFCITLPLYLIYEYWSTQEIYSQVLIIFIYGMAGLSIYTILGSIFEKYYLEMKLDAKRGKDE